MTPDDTTEHDDVRNVALELAQTIVDHATFHCLCCGEYGYDCRCERKVQDRARDNTAASIARAINSFRSPPPAELAAMRKVVEAAREWDRIDAPTLLNRNQDTAIARSNLRKALAALTPRKEKPDAE